MYQEQDFFLKVALMNENGYRKNKVQNTKWIETSCVGVLMSRTSFSLLEARIMLRHPANKAPAISQLLN